MRTLAILSLALLVACGDDPAAPVETRNADAKAADETYITWEELLVDDPGLSVIPIRGAGRMALADLDQDGLSDVVTAHGESSHIRVAWGTGHAFDWARHSLAEGVDAKEVEDVVIADFSGDGWLDIAAACRSGHLLYLQNPAQPHPGFLWKRTVIESSRGKAWTRVAAADIDGDQTPELIGVQGSSATLFQVTGAPLEQASWNQRELGAFPHLGNAQPADLDHDGDQDLLIALDGRPSVILQNDGGEFTGSPFRADDANLRGTQILFHDFSGDERVDVLTLTAQGNLTWLEQPADPDDSWKSHVIGTFSPDAMTGFTIADIDGDSHPDVMAGSSSTLLAKQEDPDRTADDPSGRIGWFRNPGASDGDWSRHDILRRQLGSFTGFAAADVDSDGAVDIIATRGGSGGLDGVFVLQQVRESIPMRRFVAARKTDDLSLPVPTAQQ